MTLSLKEWLRNGWLIEHKTNLEEIKDLFRIVDRDLKDCEVAYLSPDWRLNIASLPLDSFAGLHNSSR